MKRNKKKPGRIRTWLGSLWQILSKVFGTIYRILSYPVFSPSSQKKHTLHPSQGRAIVDPDLMPSRLQWLRENFWTRIVRPVTIRLLALPLIFFVSMALIVFLSVRTGRTEIRSFPESVNLFYEPVEFKSEDGTVLRGWFIPSLRAEEVLEIGDRALRQKRPGVVLCHGIGSNRGQLLNLASYLNRHGYETLLFDFRACGQSDGTVHSFGLRERNDVLAAVHFLADQGTVDRSRIAVIGQDVGGMAALGAAARDYSIRALVVADTDKDMQTAISRRINKTGLFWDLFKSSYLRGYQIYFRASERQLSTVRMAESLSENQSLMVMAHSQNPSMSESANIIVTHTRANAELITLQKHHGNTLMNVAKVGPSIIDFLNRALDIRVQ